MKNKGCIIGLGVLLLALTISLIYYFANQGDSGSETYESNKVEIRDIVRKAVATGSIKPRKEINIKPQVSGVVDQLYVEAGELVSKGQKIAKIKLIPNEVNINSAKNNVELAKIQLKNARRDLTNQKNLNDRNLDIDQAQTAYDIAQKEADRNQQLLDDGVISETEYLQFKLDAELKKSVLENTKVSAGGILNQFENQVDIRKQELSAAEDNLQLLREGASKNSKQISNVILSTVDGMVLDVPVEEGSSVIERNNFNEGTSIATIADMSNLIFEGKVDESDVGKLKEGMPLDVKVGAIIDKSFGAILEFISPKGVEEEGTVKFEIKAALTEQPKDVFLRAGYSANADVILERQDSVVAVQERDIIYEDDETFVEVETGDQSYEKTLVEIGVSDGIYAQVISGVDTTMSVKERKDPKADQAQDNQ